MTSRSSKLLHIDPLAIALERRKKAEESRAENQVEPELRRLPGASSQPVQSSQLTLSSQPTVSSQPAEQPPASPASNQPTAGRQPIQSSQPAPGNQIPSHLNLATSLPDVKGDSRLPHRYTDHLCRLLRPDEQAIFLQLYRLSWGWGKDTCFISNPRLSERSNVPLSTMKRAVATLISKGLIEKTGQTNGFGKDQGVEYRVLSLSWQPTASSQPALSSQPAAGTIKLKNIKTHTQTTVHKEETDKSKLGVGEGSIFSLDECRTYAEHLYSTGQGINNPGGYATTIHRTGEVDEMIERFLSPVASPTPVDVGNCPDCQGTGFYYPQGKEQGVTKCPHARLKE